MIATPQTRRRKLTHVRSAIYGQPWAITDKWLEAICEIFESNAAGLNAEMAQAAGDTYQSTAADPPFEISNGVAILPLRGPIFPRANMMTRMSGATSLEEYA